MHDIVLFSNYRSDQLSDIKDSVAETEKRVESDHSGSGNDPDIVDKKQQPDSILTRVYYTYVRMPIISIT